MTMLVIQTFMLMAALVAIGIGIGVVARQTADRRADRLVAAGLPAPEDIVTEDEAIAAVDGLEPGRRVHHRDDVVVDPDRGRRRGPGRRETRRALGPARR